MMRCIVACFDADGRDDGLALTRTDRRHVRQYAEKLPEPQRAIFLARLNGQTPQEIGRDFGMDVKLIARTLAKAYAGLRVSLID